MSVQGPSTVAARRRAGVTVCGVQAVLRQAATIVGQVGFAQGTLERLTGEVCLIRAIELAADGDGFAEQAAYETVSGLLEAETGQWSLVDWTDHPDRTRRQAQDLLLRACQVVVA